MSRVGIVLLNYHGDEDTEACLQSLSELTTKHAVNIYVVDVESTKKWKVRKNVTIISLHENLGFSGGNNVGIRKALEDDMEYVVLLNNDTTVSADFLEPLIQTLKNANIGLVSPLIYFYPGKEFHSTLYREKERGRVIWYGGGVIDWNNMYGSHWGVDEVFHGQLETTDTDFATGCCVAVSAKTLKKVGLLNENYFLYWEDVDWSLRVRQNGKRVVFNPQSVVWHKNAGSTGGSGSNTHLYYQTRNRISFARTYANFRTKFALMRESIRELVRSNPAKRKGIIDGWLGKVGKVDL